jgi:hypothetical protein
LRTYPEAPGLERGGDLLLLDEARHRDDLRLGPLGLDPADRGDAVHVRHQQVHQDDVGLEPAGHGDALAAIGGLADDLDVVLQVEEHAEAHPDDRVVVDDQDADAGAVLHGASSGTRPDRCESACGGCDRV